MDTIDIITIIIGGLGIISYLSNFRNGIFNNGAKDRNLTDRVKNLEDEFKSVASDIKSIKENHLAHIQNDIGNIKENLSAINTTLDFLKRK